MATENKGITAWAYSRVSTDEQTESGHGLNAQADACSELAERESWNLAGSFCDEGISGAAGLDKRPGLLAAIDSLQRGDVLLVAKRDRIARDPLVMAMTEAAVNRKGARIVSAAGEGTESNDPGAVLMRRMIDAFSEYERLVIGARTKAALRAKRQRGERVSRHTPYGYRLGPDGVHLEPEPAEQAVIAEARELRDSGLSLRAVAEELERRGFMSRTGRRFVPAAVSAMVSG